MEQLTLLSAEPHAKRFPSQDYARDFLTSEGTSHSNFCGWLNERSRGGWFGRTSPAFCQSTEAGLLQPSSGGWRNSGMGSPTGFLTLNSSEFHSAAVACSLSDILETGDVPQRYYLSAKACRGILRRAEKRGKELPAQLHTALASVAQTIPSAEP